MGDQPGGVNPGRRIRIRGGTVGDVDLLCSIRAASTRELASSAYSPREVEDWIASRDDDDFRRALENGSEIFHVAERVEGGPAVGFASVTSRRGRMHLWSLFVDPDCAGQGIGSALLAAAEEDCRARGVEVLHIAASRNAVGFYRARGYRALGEFVAELSGGRPGLGAVAMERGLRTT